MRADDDNLIRSFPAGQLGHNVGDLLTANLIRLPSRCVARIREFPFHEISRSFEGARHALMPRPDSAGEPVNVPGKRFNSVWISIVSHRKFVASLTDPLGGAPNQPSSSRRSPLTFSGRFDKLPPPRGLNRTPRQTYFRTPACGEIGDELHPANWRRYGIGSRSPGRLQ